MTLRPAVGFLAVAMVVLAQVAPVRLSGQSPATPLLSLRDGPEGRRVASTAQTEFRPGAAGSGGEWSSKVARARPAVFSDGTIALTDESSIVLFDRAGRFLRRIGRRGGGPGEFGGQGVDGICVVRGDTLVAFSWTDRRVTAFGRNGRLAGTWPYPDSLTAVSASCNQDGMTVFRSNRTTAQAPEHPVASGYVGHFSGTKGLRPIGMLPVLSSFGGVREAYILPYSSDVIFTAHGSVFGFTLASIGARPDRSFRSPDHAAPYTAEDREAFIRNSVPAGMSRQQREMLEASMRGGRMPQTWPSLSGALVDHISGDVWLRLFSKDPLTQHWVVIAPATGRTGRVILPPEAREQRWRLLDIRGTTLTVEWLDADDIPHVGTFRVSS